MLSLSQFLLAVQRFLAPRRILITRLFVALEAAVILLLLTVMVTAETAFDRYYLELYELGAKLGTAAIILYVLTLLPGIITRLQWYAQITQPVGSILMVHRRHLGILMFITAWAHMSLTTSLPQLALNGFDPSQITLSTHQVMGQIGWLLLFPLWLTSNDFSVKKMGKWWKVLHRLTYIALFFIFMHVALQQANWLFVMAAMLVLEVISWVKVWRRKPTTSSLAQPV